MVSAFGFGTSQRGKGLLFDHTVNVLGSPVNEKVAKLVPGPGQYQAPEPEKVKKRSPTWG
jgi:hypothetical protein